MVPELGWLRHGARALTVVALVGCGTSKPSPSPAPGPGADDEVTAGGVADGELALTLGDPVRAVAILEAIGEDDAGYAYAQELVEEARGDLRAVVGKWTTEIDKDLQGRRLSDARARIDYLERTFPLTDEEKAAVEERRESLDIAHEAARKVLLDVEQNARDLLLSHDLASALQLLRDNRAMAWDIDRDRAMRWERMIAATDLRYEAAIAEGLLDRGEDRGVDPSRADPARVRRTPRRRTASGAEIDVGAAAREQAIWGLLAEAKTAADTGDYFTAIKVYERVLTQSPHNAEATKALTSLAPKRKEVVEHLLAQANQFFLRQELESAVPFYEKVLELQPGNKQAVEGLRMHENLQKIRDESKGR